MGATQDHHRCALLKRSIGDRPGGCSLSRALVGPHVPQIQEAPMDETASFGYWLRRRRKALDLTQAALATRVGCALITIQKIEADERRPSREVAERLAGILEVPAQERAQFLRVARAELAVDRLAAPTPPADQVVRAPVARPLPSGTVTFLFTDIAGSTRLWEQHPQAMPAALTRHDAIVRAAIEGHGGAVFKTVGDAFCAAFARAPDALAAALVVQRALCAEAWGAYTHRDNAQSTIQNPTSKIALRVGMALHTGLVELAGEDYRGLALSRVARLLAAGHGGQVLLSRATAELVRDHLPRDAALRDLGEHPLKDLSYTEQIFQRNTAVRLDRWRPPSRKAWRSFTN